MIIETKSRQVESYLRNEIRRGHWAPGDRISPERVILERLRVSRATFREALTRLAGEGLIERKQGAGTFVSRNIDNTTVGIVAKMELLASPNGYYFKMLVEEGNRCISQADYHPKLLIWDGNNGSVFKNTGPVSEWGESNGMAGILSTCWIDQLYEERLTSAGIHLVSVVPVEASGNCVVLDYPYMIRKARELLKSHGYDDFAIMYLGENSGEENDSETEFGRKFNQKISRATMQALDGNKDRAIRVPSIQGYEETCEKFKRLWFSEHRPQAVLFTDDVVCEMALRVIQELGISVPDELGIVTLSNVGRNFHFPVPLTCLELDPKEVMTTAWRMLEKLINNGQNGEKVVYIRPKVREGKSL